MRLRLDLAYDGTDFSGWATQPGLRTVQNTVESWITQVLGLPEPARLVVAGRTDAGVHATGQVAHLDLPDGATVSLRDGTHQSVEHTLAHRLPRVLPEDVALRQVSVVEDTFDARFSAIWRRYEYRLWDDLTIRDPLLRRRSATVRGELDLTSIRTAAQLLLGLHDFAAFCKPREGASTIRTLQQLDLERTDSGEVLVQVRADAFCHSMVRSLVGALVGVGSTSRRIARDQQWLAGLLHRSARDSSVEMMPARGLTLVEVGYPDPREWAPRAQQARHRRDASELDTPEPAVNLEGNQP